MSNTHNGYFLIADITGYTAYLSGSELDHAQQTLSALLNLLIDNTRPPLVISRTAGDAVISYGLGDNFLQGQTFIELIEDTYVNFRRAIDLMVLNTSCPCNACKNISSLDLKFFVHYGAFGLQKLGTNQEMVGTDVNLIHRLLKNTVTQKFGFRAYALYTDVAIRQLGLEAMRSTLQVHEERYEHIGSVPVCVQDLHPVWEAKKDAAEVRISPDKELTRVETVVPAGPEVVWDYIIQPEHFNIFLGGTKTAVTGQVNGRITAGSAFQCYHGDTYSTLTILVWKPFERILITSTIPVPVKGVTMPVELRLEPVDGGTQLTQVFGLAEGPAHGRAMVRLMFGKIARQVQQDMDKFSKHIAADLAAVGR